MFWGESLYWFSFFRVLYKKETLLLKVEVRFLTTIPMKIIVFRVSLADCTPIHQKRLLCRKQRRRLIKEMCLERILIYCHLLLLSWPVKRRIECFERKKKEKTLLNLFFVRFLFYILFVVVFVLHFTVRSELSFWDRLL